MKLLVFLCLCGVVAGQANLPALVTQFKNTVSAYLSDAETKNVLSDLVDLVVAGKYKNILGSDGAGIIGKRAPLKAMSAASVYNNAKSCFQQNTKTTIGDYVNKTAGPILTNKFNTYLQSLDKKNSNYKSAGDADAARKNNLCKDAKAALTKALIKAAMTAVMKKSTDAEWKCTCTHLPQILGPTKQHMNADCSRTV